MKTPGDLAAIVASELLRWDLLQRIPPKGGDPAPATRIRFVDSDADAPSLLTATGPTPLLLHQPRHRKRHPRLVERRLVLASHFSPEADLVLTDPLLGTLGLVWALGEELEIGRAIDQSAYAHHLLNAGRRTRDPLAPCVEAVLVVEEARARGQSRLARLGHRLREYAAAHDTLRHIGLRVVQVPARFDAPNQIGADGFDQDGDEEWQTAMRRAFPWLLRHTGDLCGRVAPPEPAVPSLERLELTGYRSLVHRRVSFQRTPVHLVHGLNGSGKSSLAEAVELALTGTLDRLPAGHALDEMVRFRPADADEPVGGPAKVTMYFGDDAEPAIWTIDGTSALAPLSALGSPVAFRLNQALMNRLTRADDVDRAAAFIEGFFPEARQHEEQLRTARRELEERLEEFGDWDDTLTSALAELDRLSGWTLDQGVVESVEFGEKLNTWLRVTALADLAGQRLAIGAVARDAFAVAGTERAPAETLLELAEPDAEALDAACDVWHAASEELLAWLKRNKPGEKAEGDESSGAPIAAPNAARIDALDEAGRLLDPHATGSVGGLGTVLAGVMGGDSGTWGGHPIGNEGWAGGLVEDLAALHDALRAARDERDPPWPSGKPGPDFSALKAAVAAVDEAKQEVTTAFCHQIAELGIAPALNELVALFTTASWGYEDINLTCAESEERQEVGFAGRGNTRLELRFNTAELNLLTIALFLLCARRRPNPLRLLVLDDPLQNMDELTVATLARGLARLLRHPAWSAADRRWELLVLLHSEDNVDRFATELGLPVYRLPWLSPGGHQADSEDPDVQVEGDRPGVMAVAPLGGPGATDGPS